MSFIFCPLYKFLLIRTLKDRISAKISEIQGYFYWSDFDLSYKAGDIDLSDINYDDIAHQALVWEEVAKLSVDLWRDYEYYSRFMFESRFQSTEYRRRLEDLGYVLEGGRWKSARKPDEESVQTNVFMHCLYRMMVDEMRKRRDSVEEGQNVDVRGRSENDDCPFCGGDVRGGDRSCGDCGVVEEDILNQRILKARGNMRNEVKEGGASLGERVCTRNMEIQCELIDDGGTLREARAACGVLDAVERGAAGGASLENVGTKEVGVRPSYVNVGYKDTKWTCGKCECLNKYENANCVACGALYREGRWRCGGCTMENSGANEACGACGRKNANIAAPVARGAQRGAADRNVRCCPKCAVRYEAGEDACKRCDKQQDRGTMDQWECGKCKISVSYGLEVCGGCHSSRVASGRWSCTKCAAVNTFRDSKCTVCATENECIGVKYCVECHINKAREREERCDDCGRKKSITYAPIRWKCGYTKCGELNDDANQYCRECRLHRLHLRGRGEVVKVSRDGDERVWICVKCGSFNELEDPVCPRCAETRYKKRFCKGCKLYNDGTSTSCDTCHRGLE